MLCGWPTLSSQLLSSLPTVSTTNVLSPSQCPTEYPYHLGSGALAEFPPTSLGSCRPSVQISRHTLLNWNSSSILPGISANAIPLVMKSMLRGNPSGSHPLMGSFDSETGNWLLFLWRRNCSRPQGVRGATSLSLAATCPAQNPVRSRRGAAPPLPVSPNLSYKVSAPPRFGLGEVWANTCGETSSAPAKLTTQTLSRFRILAPLTASN